MTSTTSAFIPAAARAGAPAYSPDASASLSTTDASESPSFEELCLEERGRGDADRTATSASSEEPATRESEPKGEAETVDVAADDSDAAEHADDQSQDDDDTDDHTDEVIPVESPTIVQSLLASLREVVPMVVTTVPQVNPAENAASSPSPSASAASVRSDGRQPNQNEAGTSNEAPATMVRRQGRAPSGRPNPDAEATTSRQHQPSAAASPRATDKDATTTASPVSAVARTKAAPAEDTSAQVTVARLLHAKGHVEKTAGQTPVLQPAQIVAGQNKFLNADNQDVINSTRAAGTRSALSGGNMSSSTTSTATRRADSPASEAASPTTAGQGAWTETLSVDWKGWTNGGGERSSTAAQFSQLGEKLTHLAVAATPANATAARAATSGATFSVPVTPTVPAEAAEALAPIHSAIERLVLHGRDQLALTVRFEQGGSLSIRLAMNQGEIATQIQTDVPGLEAALKSAWGDLAQDWNSRGWKLGQPEFATNTATYHSREDATADGRNSGRQARQNADEAPDFGGRAFSPSRLKHAGAVALSGLDALRAAALARRGIHTWA